MKTLREFFANDSKNFDTVLVYEYGKQDRLGTNEILKHFSWIVCKCKGGFNQDTEKFNIKIWVMEDKSKECCECIHCKENREATFECEYYCDSHNKEPRDIHNIYAETSCDDFERKQNEKEQNESNVDHPQHYNHDGFETIDKIKSMLTYEEYIGFLRGNVIKYLDRADYKGHKEEDKAKANWYLKKIREELYGDNA